MGWKTIEQHYGIEHTVHVIDGNFYIGSHLCHDLAVLDRTGKLVKESIGFWSDRRAPWVEKIEQDCKSGKFKELAEAPDSFGELIDVFTHKNSQIITKQCEKDKFGYPHRCTDGELMYENTFFKTRGAAERSLAYDSVSWLVSVTERLDERTEELEGLSNSLRKVFEGLINSSLFSEKTKENLAWRIEQMDRVRKHKIVRNYKKPMECQPEQPHKEASQQ